MQVAEPSKAVPASWGGLLGVCAARTQLSASVPAVLAAVLLAALVVALLVHRRRCRRRQGTASAESATSSPPTIAKLEEQRSMDPLEELPPTPEPRELVIAPATQPSPTVGSLAVREAQQQAPPQPSPSVGSLAVGEAQQQAPPQPASAPPAAVGPGLPDGTHQVRFADGSAYYGEWRGGSMHGRGVFLWPGGARYEGEWQDGREEGTGTFFAPGRGTYYGSWQGGQMHGKCVYTPAAGSAAPAAAEAKLSAALPGQVVFLQRYDCGQLVSEQVLRVAHKDVRKKQQKKEGKKQAKREAKQLQAYHTPKPGEAVYKGHWSYILMRQLQLGLTFCIAQAGLAATAVVDLQEEDFHQETTQHFPIGAETPPFKWKDYAPRVFQQLREEFGIDNSDYLLSLTGEAALRLLGSPGKSGSVFFLSDDDRFLVKTVRKEEMRLLLELIPRYFRHVRANPCTLLVRFYGVHRISPLLGRRVRFIVMGNVLPSDLRMHRRYDLKGSTHGRTAGPQERGANPFATLKDLDVDMQLVLPAKQHGAVLRQLRRDLELLERLHVIDYSLLLGVHFLRWGNAAWHPPFADWPLQPAAVAEAAAGGSAQGSIHGSVEGSVPASPVTADEGTAPASPVAAGEGSWAGAALAEGGTTASPTAAAAAMAATFATQPAQRMLSKFRRSTSIDAANSLAALIAASVQPPGPLVQQAQQALLPVQQAPLASVEQVEPAAELQAGQEQQDGFAAAAASLMQTANLSRAQARLSARAALQAAGNGDGSAAAPPPAVAVAGVPPLPQLPPIAEATESGNPSSSRARQRSESSSGSTSRFSGASTASIRGSSGSSYLSAESGPGPPPAGPDIASELEAAAAAALALGTNSGAAAAATGSQHTTPQQQQQPAAPGWWPDLTCGLGGAAACLASGPAGLGSEEQAERWARHPPQPALPLSPHELTAGAAGAAQAQHEQRQQLHAEQADQEQCIVLDSRAASGSLLGSSFDSRPASCLGAAASQWPAATAAACAALRQQQEHLGRLLSLRGSGEERESLGRAVPAVAVRRSSGGQLQCEPVLLYFGVIDFLQDYTLRKHLERWTKAAVWGGQAVSVAAPGSYSYRFLAAMQRVLVSSEAAEAGLGCSECGGGGSSKGAG